MKIVTALLLSLLTVPAHAQNKQTWTVDTVHKAYDTSTDLGKAMSICAQHRHLAPGMQPKNGTYIVQYDDGWTQCEAVHAAWLKSQDANDNVFVSGVAKGLKP